MASTSGRDEAAQAPDAWKLSDKPMDHYEVTGTGANKTLNCKWCQKGFKGSGSRAYSHLVDGKDVAKCVMVDKETIQRLKAGGACSCCLSCVLLGPTHWQLCVLFQLCDMSIAAQCVGVAARCGVCMTAAHD